MNPEIISIPAISAIVYWVINLLKITFKSEKFKQFIPLTACLLGIAFGIVCYFSMPEIIPADNILIAIVIGGASGLTATGTNQVFKQLKNNNK